MDPSALESGDDKVLEPVSPDTLPPESAEPALYKRGWRRVVINFTPSWFSVNMGTGITSILLHNLPFNGTWLYWISVIVFCLNILLFVAFSIITAMRYIMFPGMWSVMIKHPVQSLFLGAFPMGLATIINMIVFVCVPAWGQWAAILAWVLWWIDVVAALACNLYLPFVIMFKHENKLSTMTAAWLLPVVATIVASSSGAIVAAVLPNDQHAIWTITICYILWGCGLPLAMFTMVMYFQRLTLHKLPPREVIVSVFLPIGPLGQGAFGIMQLGKDALELFGRNQYIPMAPMAGQIFYSVGILTAFIMWGFGIVWLFFALASITRSKFPFNLGWWGFTFPLGVYAAATVELGQVLPSDFFKVLGTIFSLVVVFLWIFVSLGTIRYTFFGTLLSAPCIADWEASQKNKEINGGKS